MAAVPPEVPAVAAPVPEVDEDMPGVAPPPLVVPLSDEPGAGFGPIFGPPDEAAGGPVRFTNGTATVSYTHLTLPTILLV